MKQNQQKIIGKYKDSLWNTVFQCEYPLWMLPKCNTTTQSTLIPRNVIHNIVVLGFYTDMWMELEAPIRRTQRSASITPLPLDESHNLHNDLHEAAERGDMAAVENALRCDGSFIRKKDSHGNLPLHLAVINGHKAVATYLVEKYLQGSYVLNRENKSPVYYAVEKGYVDVVGCMLRAYSSSDRKGKSIVHAAIELNNTEMVKIILSSQRDLIKSKDRQGRTPLSYASYIGNRHIVKYLLKHFPKCHKDRDEDDSYAVHNACKYGHVEILKVFHSKAPKSLLSKDSHGRNILHIAAKEPANKLKNVVSYLLSLDSTSITSTSPSTNNHHPFNKQDEYGDKPLALARENNNGEIVSLLKAAGLY